MDVDVKLTEHDGPLAPPPEKEQSHVLVSRAAGPQVRAIVVGLQAAPPVGSLGQLWTKTGESLQMTKTVTKGPLAAPPEEEQSTVMLPKVTPQAQTPVVSLQDNRNIESQSSTVVKLSDVVSVPHSKQHGVNTPVGQDRVQGMVPQATVQAPLPGPQTLTGSLGWVWEKTGESPQAAVTQDGQAPLGNSALLEGEGGIHNGVVEETKTAENVHPLNPHSESQHSAVVTLSDIVGLSVLQSEPQGVNTPAGQDGAPGVTQKIPPTIIYGTPVIIGGRQYIIVGNPPTQAGSGGVRLAQPPVCVVAPTQTAAMHQKLAGGSRGPSGNTISFIQQNLPVKASTSAPQQKMQHMQLYKNKGFVQKSKKIVVPPTAKKDKVKKPSHPHPYCHALGIELKKPMRHPNKLELRLLSNGVMKELYQFANTTKTFYNTLVFDILKKWFRLDVEDDLSYKFAKLVSCKLIEMGKRLNSRFEVKARFKLPEVQRRPEKQPISKELVQAMAMTPAKYNIDPKLPMPRIIQRIRSRLLTKRKWDNERAIRNEQIAVDTFRKSLENMRCFLDTWVHKRVSYQSTIDTLPMTTTVSPATTTVTPHPVDRATLGENNGPFATGRNVGSPLSGEPVEKETSPQLTSSTQSPGEPAPTVTQSPREPAPTAEFANGEFETVEVTVDTTGAEERPMENNVTDDEQTDDCTEETPQENDLSDGCITKEHDYFLPNYPKLSPVTSYPICSEMGVNLHAKSDEIVIDKIPVKKLTNAVMMEIHDFATEISSSAMQVVSRIVKHYFELDFQTARSLDSEDWLGRLKQITSKLKSLRSPPPRLALLQQTFTFTEEIEKKKQTKAKVQPEKTTEPSEKYQRLKEMSEKRRLVVQKNREARATQAEERNKKAQKQKQQTKYQPHRSLQVRDHHSSVSTPARVKDHQPSVPTPVGLYRHSPVSERSAVPVNLMQYIRGNNLMHFIKEEQEECSVGSLNSQDSVSKQSVIVPEKTKNVNRKDAVKDEHDGLSMVLPVKTETVHGQNVMSCVIKDEQEAFAGVDPVKTETVDGQNVMSCVIKDEHETFSEVVPVKTEMVDGQNAMSCVMKDELETFSEVVPVKMEMVDGKDGRNVINKQHEERPVKSSYHVSMPEQSAVPVKTEMVDETDTIKITIKDEHSEVFPKSLGHNLYSQPSGSKRSAVTEREPIKIIIKDEHIKVFSKSSGHYQYSRPSVSKRSAVTEQVETRNPMNICIKEVFSSVSRHCVLPVKTVLFKRKDTMNLILRDPEFSVEGLPFQNSMSKQSALPVKAEIIEEKNAIHVKKEHEDSSVDPPHSLVSKKSAIPVKTEKVDETDTINIIIKDVSSESTTVRREENLRHLSHNLALTNVKATSLKRKAETEMEPHPESKASKTTRDSCRD